MSGEMAREEPFNRLTQVGQEMEPVGTLDGLRCRRQSRRSVVSSTISAHHSDFWMGPHPGGGGFGFPIRQNIENLMTLQIDQERSIDASTLERKIINAELGDLSNWLGGQRHDAAKQRVACGLDAHAICDASAQSASSRQAKRLEQFKESCRHTRARSNEGGQPFGKDFSWATRLIAEKFPHRELNAHSLPRAGQIGQFALIATMNPCRCSATQGTRRTWLRGQERNVQTSFQH